MLGMAGLAGGKQNVQRQWIEEIIHSVGQITCAFGSYLLYTRFKKEEWDNFYNIFKQIQQTIQIFTPAYNGLYDVTRQVEAIVAEGGAQTGMVNVYVQGATAGIMMQENWDQSVQNDVINLLNKLIPHGIWEHDAQDDNADSHLKAGIVGPQETIPIID